MGLLLTHHQPRGRFFSLGVEHLEVPCPNLSWPPPASFVTKGDRHIHRAVYLAKISLRYGQLGYKDSLRTHRGAQRDNSSWRHSNRPLPDYLEVHPRGHQPIPDPPPQGRGAQKHNGEQGDPKLGLRARKTLSRDCPRRSSATLPRSETQQEKSPPEHLLD